MTAQRFLKSFLWKNTHHQDLFHRFVDIKKTILIHYVVETRKWLTTDVDSVFSVMFVYNVTSHT